MEDLRSEKYTTNNDIWTVGVSIICETAKIEQMTSSGVILAEQTADKEARNPNQVQKVVAVGPDAYEFGVKPGDYVFIRRDLFVPRYKINGEDYDQPSVHQVSAIISKELKSKHDSYVRGKGNIIPSAYGATAKEQAQKKF